MVDIYIGVAIMLLIDTGSVISRKSAM